MSKLYIKNMVCDRCKASVKNQLVTLGFNPVAIQLGEVTVTEELDGEKKMQINQSLLPLGFELIDDKKTRIIENIKTTIIELVHYSEDQLKTKFSQHISEKLHHDYNYLSNLFSQVEGTTIEKYFIAQKIEKVKELLVYDELSLNEIADQLNYSSAAYLSAQFKNFTGMTPTQFKNLKDKKRISLDKL